MKRTFKRLKLRTLEGSVESVTGLNIVARLKNIMGLNNLKIDFFVPTVTSVRMLKVFVTMVTSIRVLKV